MATETEAFLPSIAPVCERDVYLVLDDFGRLGRAWPETDDDRCGLKSAPFTDPGRREWGTTSAAQCEYTDTATSRGVARPTGAKLN